jgi:hypothetical protein
MDFVYALAQEAAEGLAEIIVAKQRQGPTGVVKFAFNKDTTAFEPLSYANAKGVEPYKPEPEDKEEERVGSFLTLQLPM